MGFHSSLTIVASPRPRVGKTLLARLLCGFHRSAGREVNAFDLNAGEGTLSLFAPQEAVRANIRDVRGQMALYDSLVALDGTYKVVDCGAQTFAEFFTLAEQIGLMEESRARGIALAVMYIITPDRTSVEAYRNLCRRFPQAMFVPVHNEMFGPTQHRDRYPLSSGDSVVRLPALAPHVRKYIETPPFAFTEAEIDSVRDISDDAIEEVQRWLRRIYVEFREVDLRILLTDLKSSILSRS